MEIVFVLIPLSIILVLLALRAFAWSIDNGQFDHLERESVRILMERDEPGPDCRDQPDADPREDRS